jgi:hypothetical protein
MNKKREEMMKQQMLNQTKTNEQINIDPIKKLNEMSVVINNLLSENGQLKDKIKYLEEKIKNIILEKIDQKKEQLVKKDYTVSPENTFNVKTI